MGSISCALHAFRSARMILERVQANNPPMKRKPMFSDDKHLTQREGTHASGERPVSTLQK